MSGLKNEQNSFSTSGIGLAPKVKTMFLHTTYNC